eukprot:m.203471 g.203471  ORF g.203471 m.203471 type:complete len:305 (-) comp18847_c0_seq2:2337-3251(-)
MIDFSRHIWCCTMEPTPNWRRAPLTKGGSSSSLNNSFSESTPILHSAHHQVELPSIHNNRQRNDAATGPNSTVPHASAQKIQFIQDQHSHALSSLLSEIERLKAENRDLKFRLVLRDSAAHADAGSSATLQKELTGLRQKLDTTKLERDDLQFDLRAANTRITELEARIEEESPGTGAIEEENRRLYMQLREREKEITHMRETKNMAEQAQAYDGKERPPVSSLSMNMSERPYVFNSQDLKHKSSGRRLTQQQLSSLAEQRRRTRAVRRFDGASAPKTSEQHQNLPSLYLHSSQEQSQQQRFYD